MTNLKTVLADRVADVNNNYDRADWYACEKALNADAVLTAGGLVVKPELKADVEVVETLGGKYLYGTGRYALESVLVADWEGGPDDDEGDWTDEELETLLRDHVEATLEDAGVAVKAVEWAGYNRYNGVNEYRAVLAEPLTLTD